MATATITLETAELTLRKTVDDPHSIAEHNTVDAIVAIVDAYDAAHRYKDYSVREHLRDALSH